MATGLEEALSLEFHDHFTSRIGSLNRHLALVGTRALPSPRDCTACPRLDQARLFLCSSSFLNLVRPLFSIPNEALEPTDPSGGPIRTLLKSSLVSWSSMPKACLTENQRPLSLQLWILSGPSSRLWSIPLLHHCISNRLDSLYSHYNGISGRVTRRCASC